MNFDMETSLVRRNADQHRFTGWPAVADSEHGTSVWMDRVAPTMPANTA